MAVEVTGSPAARSGAEPAAARPSPLAALAAAGAALARGTSLQETLDAIVAAVAQALGAAVVVVRVLDADGRSLTARAIVTTSPAVAAVLDGSRVRVGDIDGETDDLARLPAELRAAAVELGAQGVLLVPAGRDDGVLATLELVRVRQEFTAEERLLARAAAAQLAAAVRLLGGVSDGRTAARVEESLELAGEALAAGAADARTAEEIARVAVQASGALGCIVWTIREDGALAVLAAHGHSAKSAAQRVRGLAEEVLAQARPLAVGHVAAVGPVASLPLGQPPAAVLQLLFAESALPGDAVLARLATFAVRAANALGSSRRGRMLELELERTRALLELVAQANEELSLAHTLQTAIDRIAELLDAERIGVYLREEGRLVAAAGRALAGPHTPIAERLLGLALGPFRGRGMLVVEDAVADPALAGLQTELGETGIEAALAVPLVVPNEVVGLLVVYPERGRLLTANESALIGALAAQLAVSVQNARLHEQATQLGTELEQVLELERQAARQLRSLYEISRSFAQSLSLETTLDAAARTIVELLDVDAAVIRMPDARRETLVPRALHVADVRLAPALRTVLARPQRLDSLPRRSLLTGEALVLDADSAETAAAHQLLVPFLEKGSTAVVLPIAMPTELLGTIELLSLDPARPITRETVEIGLSVAAQAALAIDNARLYQLQKEFTDTMQRSLLPRDVPKLPSLDVGDVYAASARLDVGGDLYDFMTLADGRLAVVLGDVTGHGVEAAADMAMAKFVFRSLAREHPDPRDFLAAANDVVCGEIAPGKFITMLYLTIDTAAGEIACASAGHPRPRLVLPDASVRSIQVSGLALGIDPEQTYDEVRERFDPGAAVVLYTDGVLEARREGELYGPERLDALLAEQHELPAGRLALSILDACRAFAGGDLEDDCAIVVVKRTDA